MDFDPVTIRLTQLVGRYGGIGLELGFQGLDRDPRQDTFALCLAAEGQVQGRLQPCR